MMSGANLRTIGLGLCLFVGGLFSGFLAYRFIAINDMDAGKPEVLAGTNAMYRLTNPLLSCGDMPNVISKDIAALKGDVNAMFDDALSSGEIVDAAIYFRDLNNGPWFGVNPDMKFSPGSLLKVPLMIGVLKQAEREPALLGQKVRYDAARASATLHLLQQIPPEHPLVPGGEYTVLELLEAMIRDSDNDAMMLLATVVDRDDLDKVYEDLGVQLPADAAYEVSVHTYASFLRILFNATYLNRAMSEKALGILAGTTFRGGLRAGVPPEVIVARKFGERRFEGSDIQQFHDCGIVYAPNHPYLFCIMTRGKDFSVLKRIVQNVAALVYQRIASL